MRQVDLVHRKVFQPVSDPRAGTGQETGANPPRPAAQPEVKTRRLDLLHFQRHISREASRIDELPNSLGRKNALRVAHNHLIHGAAASIPPAAVPPVRLDGRAGGIRTHDLMRPMHARYQAALRPDTKKLRRCVRHGNCPTEGQPSGDGCLPATRIAPYRRSRSGVTASPAVGASVRSGSCRHGVPFGNRFVALITRRFDVSPAARFASSFPESVRAVTQRFGGGEKSFLVGCLNGPGSGAVKFHHRGGAMFTHEAVHAANREAIPSDE